MTGTIFLDCVFLKLSRSCFKFKAALNSFTCLCIPTLILGQVFIYVSWLPLTLLFWLFLDSVFPATRRPVFYIQSRSRLITVAGVHKPTWLLSQNKRNIFLFHVNSFSSYFFSLTRFQIWITVYFQLSCYTFSMCIQFSCFLRNSQTTKSLDKCDHSLHNILVQICILFSIFLRSSQTTRSLARWQDCASQRTNGWSTTQSKFSLQHIYDFDFVLSVSLSLFWS